MPEYNLLIDSGTEAYLLIYFSQLHLDTPYPLIVTVTPQPVPKQPVIKQVHMYIRIDCTYIIKLYMCKVL